MRTGIFIRVIFILAAGLFVSGCADIKVGEMGVRNNKIIGQIKKKPLQAGLAMNVPWVHELVIYNVRETTLELVRKETSGDRTVDELDFKTSDGQKLFFDVTVVYQIDPAKIVDFHQNVGNAYLRILKDLALSECRIEVGKYTADEIYQGKTHDLMNKAVTERLHSMLKSRGIIIHNVVMFKNYEFNEEYQDLVEKKEQAKKQVEINEALANAAEAKAKETEALADGEARAVKKRADAMLYEREKEAEGVRAVGEAEAAVKKALADAMGGGDNIVMLEFARNIPDKLQIWGIPTGGNSMSFMDLSGLFKNMMPSQSAPAGEKEPPVKPAASSP